MSDIEARIGVLEDKVERITKVLLDYFTQKRVESSDDQEIVETLTAHEK